MRTPALLLALLVARVLVVWGRAVEWTPALVITCVGQDALLALLFLAVEIALRRWRAGRRATHVLFWAIVTYVAVNVVVARVLPTPLTWPMIRAAGGPIADSVRLYVTLPHVVLMLAVAASAWIGRRLPPCRPVLLAVVLGGVAVSGAWAAPGVDSWGLHRNAVVSLVTSGFPAVEANPGASTWHRRSAEPPASTDVSHLSGLAEGRNVLFIGLESTGAQYLRLYGAIENAMPSLETLAAQALVFDRAYAVSPDSIRSLFSVLCSRYPAFDTPAESYASAPCGSLFSALAPKGYRTSLFHSGRFSYLGMQDVIRGRGFDTLEDAGHIGGNHQSSFGVDEPAAVDRLLAWVDSLAPGDRFAAYYMPVAGHHPYAIAGQGSFGAATDLDRYRSALFDGDRSIGALIEGLRARRRYDNTLFVVFADHGQAFGQHPGNFGHTFFLFEENVRVPFFIAMPGAMTRQRRSDVAASLVDVGPTVFDLLGLPADPSHQGESALRAVARSAPFFTDYAEPLVGLRDGPWKFIHNLAAGRSWLFNLEMDPAETRDLSAQQPARAAAYAESLRTWSATQKALMQDRDR